MKAIKFLMTALCATAVFAACEEPKDETPSITTDPTEIKDIPCDSPAEQSFIVKSNVNWVLQYNAEMIQEVTPNFGPAGNTVVTVKVKTNYVNEKTDRAARSATLNISGSGATAKVELSQLGYTAPVEQKLGGIPDLAEFKACVEMLNAGGNPERWLNDAGEIALLADIDLSGETNWTPLGLGKMVGTSVKGEAAPIGLDAALSIRFNGNGHKITGINFSFDPSVEEGCPSFFGIFGYLEKSVIKNLIVGKEGDKITVTGKMTNTCSVAGVLGCGREVEMLDVTNNVDIIYNGTPEGSEVQFAMAGILANGISCKVGTEANPCVNNGDVYCEAAIKLGEAGEGGHMVAGIQGFMKFGTIEGCKNYGLISCDTGRGAGIVASINNQATADNPGKVLKCTNYGTIRRDVKATSGGVNSNKKRMGGIFGGAEGWYNVIDGCVNEGLVMSETACRCGGITGHGKIQIRNCENKGVILSDKSGDHGPGWLAGYCDSYANAIKGCGQPNVYQCTMGGKVGDYSTYKDNPEGAPAATIDNVFYYNNKPMDSPEDTSGSFLRSEIIVK